MRDAGIPREVERRRDREIEEEFGERKDEEQPDPEYSDDEMEAHLYD